MSGIWFAFTLSSQKNRDVVLSAYNLEVLCPWLIASPKSCMDPVMSPVCYILMSAVIQRRIYVQKANQGDFSCTAAFQRCYFLP